MGMRIRTNVASLVSQRFMNENSSENMKSLERLSSGYRINRSADDAAGLAVSESIRAKTRGLNVAKRNANDAVSMIQIAEGSMNEMNDILIRLRELTVQASSDTIGNNERGYLNREYTQLVQEMDRIVKTTEFNNIKLFQQPDSDEPSQFVIQVGTNYSLPEENQDTISINLEGLRFTSEDLGFATGNEIGPQTVDEIEDSPSRDDIAMKLTTIDNAINKMASERATLGSVQSRLTSSMRNIASSVENLETAKSRIRDVDFASETSNLSQTQVMLSSNTAVLAQANARPEMALQLLR